MKSLSAEQIKTFFNSKLKVDWRGTQGTALCPFHDDHKPSLSVNAQIGAFYCHGCGAQGGLTEFEQQTSGLNLITPNRRVAPMFSPIAGRKVMARYRYFDESGDLLYEQVRHEPKGFRFRRSDGNGGWIWNLGEVRRIPYRLRSVLKANRVFVAEGERDVESLRGLGLAATCNPGGAGKWRDEFADFFDSKTVIVLQDNDEPGRKHALQVAESVSRQAAEVKLLPTFKGAKDVSEWIEAGGTKEELLQLVRDTPRFVTRAAEDKEQAAQDSLAPNDWRLQPLSGVWVVRLLEDFFETYAILPEGVPFVLALWVIASHFFDIFDVFPYLSVTSPLKRCGKTRVAELIELLSEKALNVVNVSEAALFRTIEQLRPVVIIDEAETLANRKSERSQYLLALLQAGFKKGAVVPRCAGRDHKLEYFSVFGPKVVLAIGTLPDTLLDRSVQILMQRKTPDQVVAQFRQRLAKDQAEGPRHATHVWCESNRTAVEKAYFRQRIDFLRDREADIWEPLFAVASIAIPARTEELKHIALRLSGEKRKSDVDESEGLKLLADIKGIFQGLGDDRIHTDELIFKLKARSESPWENITPNRLARMLRPFEITSRQVWIDEINRRGYEFADFEAAFERYLSTRQRR